MPRSWKLCAWIGSGPDYLESLARHRKGRAPAPERATPVGAAAGVKDGDSLVLTFPELLLGPAEEVVEVSLAAALPPEAGLEAILG